MKIQERIYQGCFPTFDRGELVSLSERKAEATTYRTYVTQLLGSRVRRARVQVVSCMVFVYKYSLRFQSPAINNVYLPELSMYYIVSCSSFDIIIRINMMRTRTY